MLDQKNEPEGISVPPVPIAVKIIIIPQTIGAGKSGVPIHRIIMFIFPFLPLQGQLSCESNSGRWVSVRSHVIQDLHRRIPCCFAKHTGAQLWDHAVQFLEASQFCLGLLFCELV